VKCDIPSENKYKVTVQTIAIFFCEPFKLFSLSGGSEVLIKK